MLSADVDAGFDPIYASVSDRNNAGYVGRGISLNNLQVLEENLVRQTPNAEFVAEVRHIFEKNDIKYQ